MQNRYAGDIGDYVKLAILRALMPGLRLGVAWWLHPDEGHNSDGKHISFLKNPAQWRHLDPELFSHLKTMHLHGDRAVKALEPTLPGAVFCGDTIPSFETAVKDRRHARKAWFENVRAKLESADLVFVDPDNGLEPKTFSSGSKKAGKSIQYEEVRALADGGRPMVIYHHQTRALGGHDQERRDLSCKLLECGAGSVAAFRAKPFSPRLFFLLNANDTLRQRAVRLSSRWGEALSWHD
jgi:hypothetical protein